MLQRVRARVHNPVIRGTLLMVAERNPRALLDAAA